MTSALAFISSCANPVLYTFAGKSYIKQNGFSFMARLFEGTSLSQTGNKKSRVMGKDHLGNSIIDSSNSTGIPLSQNGSWVLNDLCMQENISKEKPFMWRVYILLKQHLSMNLQCLNNTDRTNAQQTVKYFPFVDSVEWCWPRSQWCDFKKCKCSLLWLYIRTVNI